MTRLVVLDCEAVQALRDPGHSKHRQIVSQAHARLMMLTPGGHRFGQAPAAALSQDPKAGPFLAAATKLLQLITSRA